MQNKWEENFFWFRSKIIKPWSQSRETRVQFVNKSDLAETWYYFSLSLDKIQPDTLSMCKKTKYKHLIYSLTEAFSPVKTQIFSQTDDCNAYPSLPIFTLHFNFLWNPWKII